MLPATRAKTRPPLLTIAAGIIAAITALLLADPAKADPDQDNTFFATLHQMNMVVYNPALLRRQGVRVCDQLNAGTPWRSTITELVGFGYSRDEAARIFSASIVGYCPWQAEAVIHEGSRSA